VKFAVRATWKERSGFMLVNKEKAVTIEKRDFMRALKTAQQMFKGCQIDIRQIPEVARGN